MKPAIINGQCRLRGGHCLYCRTDEEHRARIGTPEICPHGFTASNLPLPSSNAGIARKKGCGPCLPVVVTR